MRTLRTVGELREAVRETRRRDPDAIVGLVPTMGALHDGHLALIRQARRECDLVVVTLFVNPAQFNERSDLERYPRNEARDAELAAGAGADALFAPSLREVYPDGFATAVEVLGITDVLEGASRGSEHFRGVTTVVTKLLAMAGPDRAYFGQKDAQQLVVIRRLVADLNLPVEIRAVPTVREPDGLAMSSRNALLDARGREQARGLSEALRAAEALAARGETDSEALLAAAHEALVRRALAPDYVALVDTRTLRPLTRLDDDGLLAIAARVGDVRLIDNTTLSASATTKHDREAVAACSA
jgi:pantoate--beta-alanine ligase